ncbi:MAG: hypothetical protein HZB56_07895 [Deltaproteobacteria bacterium]|nr:hypothetical protein [Deltaproteobacteria bacterium]
MDNGLGPAHCLDGSAWPPLVEKLRHPWRSDAEVEPTPGQVRLMALEERLATVRRILLHSGHGTEYRREVRALLSLTADLHRAVAAAALRRE